MRRATAACLATGLALFAGPAFSSGLNGPARVLDGETVEVANTVVRLHGIAAPPSGHACARGPNTYDCAQESAWALAERIGRHWLRCEPRGQEASRRVVAICYIGADIDVSAHMVRQGWALARRGEAPEYGALQAAAQRERLGLWAGSFDPLPTGSD